MQVIKLQKIKQTNAVNSTQYTEVWPNLKICNSNKGKIRKKYMAKIKLY